MSNYLICHIEGHDYDIKGWCAQCGDSTNCVHMLDHTNVVFIGEQQECNTFCCWCHKQLTLTFSEHEWYMYYSEEGFLQGAILGGGVSPVYRRGAGRFCLPQYRDGYDRFDFVRPPKFTSFYD
jgi:hypothetical protein